MIEGHEQDVKWLAEWLSDPANAEPSWMLQSNDRRASQRGVLAWHGDHIALELVRNALGPVGAGPLYVGRTNAALQLRLGPTRLGRVKASSLRGSLAALLWDELELRCAVPYTLDEVATTRLSNWMSQHLSVTIVPIGAVAYFPVVALLGRHDPLGAPDWFLPASPALGLVFLAVSLWVWGFGVRRYASTGS